MEYQSGKLGEHGAIIARKWHEAMDKLKLIVSEKTKIIPKCEAAQVVQEALREQGLEVGIEDAWVDLGVDTAVGKRSEIRLNKRGTDSVQKSRKAGFIQQQNETKKKSNVIGLAGVMPATCYGNTAIGVTPNLIKVQQKAPQRCLRRGKEERSVRNCLHTMDMRRQSPAVRHGTHGTCRSMDQIS